MIRSPKGQTNALRPRFVDRRGFETVRKVRRYEQVAEQIRRMISDGRTEAGRPASSERELVAKLGVGRSSIRDAVRTLEVMGSSSRGRPRTVCAISRGRAGGAPLSGADAQAGAVTELLTCAG